jgi:peptide/nickel transport system ATP-binding protein
VSLLTVENLKMYYTTMEGAVKAVDNVSFSVDKGKALAIAGESGCGKSSLAFTIMRLLPYNGRVIDGKIQLKGLDILSMDGEAFRKNVRWKSISIVPQAAMNSLNPVFKVGDQITEAILFHEEVSDQEARERTLGLLKKVGIDPSRANHYPHEFSGGMKQRAMIAMALACNPDLVIADEPTTALDVITQAQVIKVLKSLQEELDLSLILISHDLSVVGETCDEVAIMYAGKITECASTKGIFKSPKHPYTQGLLGSFPSILGTKERLQSIPGNPPDLIDPPPACRFNPRCKYAKRICMLEEPALLEDSEAHLAACHMANRHPDYR